MENLFDNKDIAKRQTSLCKFGLRYGLGQEAEDFASWAIIKIISNRKATNYQLYVDYMREVKGGNGKLVDVQYEDWMDKPQESEPEQEDNEIIECKASKKIMPYLILYYKYGMKEKEIAEVFGVTEARISQIIGKYLGFHKLKNYKLSPEKIEDIDIPWMVL